MSDKDFSGQLNISIMVSPTVKPIPAGFRISADGNRTVGFLTEEQVREALRRFDEMRKNLHGGSK